MVATLSRKTLETVAEWPTPAEAGGEMGMSKQAVHERLVRGTLRGVKTKQGWLVDPEAVAALRERRASRG